MLPGSYTALVPLQIAAVEALVNAGLEHPAKRLRDATTLDGAVDRLGDAVDAVDLVQTWLESRTLLRRNVYGDGAAETLDDAMAALHRLGEALAEKDFWARVEALDGDVH